MKELIDLLDELEKEENAEDKEYRSNPNYFEGYLEGYHDGVMSTLKNIREMLNDKAD